MAKLGALEVFPFGQEVASVLVQLGQVSLQGNLALPKRTQFFDPSAQAQKLLTVHAGFLELSKNLLIAGLDCTLSFFPA